MTQHVTPQLIPGPPGAASSAASAPRSGGRKRRRASLILVGQVQPEVKLVLVVVGLHVLAQLVERLVMLALFQVGQPCTTIIFRNSGAVCLNRLATRISRLALSLPPCTRDTMVCVPKAC